MANDFKNAKAVSVGPAWTQVYECPSTPVKSATVIGSSLSSLHTAQIKIQARMKDNSDAGTYVNLISPDTPVDPGGALAPWGGTQKLNLEVGDTIEVYCDTVAGLDAVISVLEIS